MRTDSGRDAGAVVGTAAAVVVADPVLWLLGIVGFGARGGLVLLTLPVLTIPSPVLLSIMFRNELSTAGTTASFDVLAVTAAAVTGGMALLAIMISAWAELHAVERGVAEAARRAVAPGSFSPAARAARTALAAAVGRGGPGHGLVPILMLLLLFVGRLTRVVSPSCSSPPTWACRSSIASSGMRPPRSWAWCSSSPSSRCS